jgi:hypothetical protein
LEKEETQRRRGQGEVGSWQRRQELKNIQAQ